MQMTHERAPTGGPEVFGEPKKLGEVTVEREGSRVRAALARHGVVFVEVRGTVDGTLPLPEPAPKTDFYFKFLPAVDGSGFDGDPLLVHCVREEKVRRLERVTGEVILRESAYDPVADLPVLRLLDSPDAPRHPARLGPARTARARVRPDLGRLRGTRRPRQPPRGLRLPAARRRTGGPRGLHGRDDLVLAPRAVAPGLRRRLPPPPELKLVLTEQGSGWIPGVLAMLDYYHGRLLAAARATTAEAKFGVGLAESTGRPPSEVWHENCFVGASLMRPHQVPLRDRIGLDKIMWGSDHPHDEGTYPYTREGLRFAFAGVPQDELAAMLGGNAAREYGFDLDLLDPIAAKVGPTAAEIAEPLPDPPADATSPVFARGASVRVW